MDFDLDSFLDRSGTAFQPPPQSQHLGAPAAWRDLVEMKAVTAVAAADPTTPMSDKYSAISNRLSEVASRLASHRFGPPKE